MGFDKYIEKLGIEIETTKTRTDRVLSAMEKLPIKEGIDKLPKLVNWNEMGDEQKLSALRTVLSGELYQIQAKYSDDRANPTKASKWVKNKYHTFVAPWMGQYLREFGKERFEQAMSAGKIDPMVKELREANLLKPGLDLASESISIASSTGSSQTLWQYDQGLQVLEEMREIVKQDDWSKVKSDLENLQLEQEQRLKLQLGFERDDVLVRMQSGSDLPLLNGIFGSTSAQITNETGTASWAAASMRHTSGQGYLGHERRKDEQGLMKKLVGFETVNDAIELELREKSGEWLDASFIKIQTELAINKIREKDPKARITIGVTAGGKTGLGWDLGGLRFSDALALRQKYGGENKTDILIAVDNSQGRLSRGEIFELKKHKVMIDCTGSKVFEGPMYSALRYIPKEYLDLAKEYVEANPECLESLGEYVTQSDLRQLLGDKLVSSLPDLPDVFSVLKWETPLVTMERFGPNTPSQIVDSQRLVREFVRDLQVEMVAVTEKTVNGHVWKVRFLNELDRVKVNSKFDLLNSFQIFVDGKQLGEKELKEIHQAMSEPGESGIMFNIGQFVGGANVLRLAPGMMSEIGLRSAPKTVRYGQELSKMVARKMSEVMEARLESIRPAVLKEGGWSDRERIEWEERLSQTAYRRMQEIVKDPEKKGVAYKVDQIVDLYGGVLKSSDILPVVLVSGKNLAAFDLLYLSWERSGRGKNYEGHEAEDLPVVFVDHPYVDINIKGKKYRQNETSVYTTLLKTITDYPHTKLYIYGATEGLIRLLEQTNIPADRYAIFSRVERRTPFEDQNPEWYKDASKVSDEEAILLNERYKGMPTDRFIHDFMQMHIDKTIAICRGNRPGQQDGREATFPINVSDKFDFLGFHLLTGLNEDEIIEWMRISKLKNVSSYRDWLKEVRKSCGLDQRFSWVKPNWYLDMIKKGEAKLGN